jgi:hypothetical protein
MRLSWPSPLPTVCSTGRFAVGTVAPATAPPPFWVALFWVAPPAPLLELPLLPQPAAITDTTASPIGIVSGRLRPPVLCLFMCPPLKGS